MLNEETIKILAPKARADYVAALAGGNAIFVKWGINTPQRLVHFLAVICHETGGLTIVRESMKYSASRIRAVWPSRRGAARFAGDEHGLANSVYGTRMGNERDGTDDDDGWLYRGGGLPQLTGYDNYVACGKAIGVDLGGHPELIENATVSLEAACWEFSRFVKFCDKGAAGFHAVCNGINRGDPYAKADPINWPDRQLWYTRAVDALGVTPVTDDTLSAGDRGALVLALQKRLLELGYVPGSLDGIFGPRMRNAVLAFQAENDLSLDGAIGPQTRAYLNGADAKPMPLGARVNATVADLREAGSTSIASTDKLKDAAKVAAVASGIAGAAKETDVLGGAQGLLSELTAVRTVTTGITDVLQWALSHWYLFAVVVAFLIWKWARTIEAGRLLSHQRGENLSK